MNDMEYIFHILIMVNIYVIITVSTSFLVGFGGLISLGQAAFYGLGAYLTAFALMQLNLPMIPTIILIIILAGGISFLIGKTSLHLVGDYFILATLAFQLIVFTILYNWTSVTKGPYGIAGIPEPELFGMIQIDGIIPFLILSTVLMLIVLGIFYRLMHSPFGRSLKGMRDDSTALQSLGKNPKKLKIQAFILAGSFTALSGFIYASYVSYIDPTSFNLDEAIFIISAVLIGGTGNIKGPAAGAVVVVILPEILRFLGMPESIAANMRMIIYGLILIVLMHFRTEGLAGKYKLK